MSFEQLQKILIFSPNSKEYAEAYQNLIEVKQIDGEAKELLDSILTESDEDEELPLKKKIDAIPNLFTVKEEQQFRVLKGALDRLAGPPLLIKPTVINYLQHLFTKRRHESVDVPFKTLITALNLLLRIFYGEKGEVLPAGEKKASVNEQIKEFLSDENTPLESISKDSFIPVGLCIALSFLKDLIYSPNIEMRLPARDICEEFRIPLNLPRLLSFSVDGIKRGNRGINPDVGSSTLVIGMTGAGKSTLINWLCGIEHVRKINPSTYDSYLEPKPGQKTPPARVGHYNSQTLFPQLISDPIKGISYIDCPGFEDDRSKEEAACATMGVPLAARHGKCISSVIITIDWPTLSRRAAGGVAFRQLSKTLSNIIKDPSNLVHQGVNGPIPQIIFVITKPKEPEANEHFNVEGSKRAAKNKIRELMREKVDLQAQKTVLNDKIKRLFSTNEILIKCKGELDEIRSQLLTRERERGSKHGVYDHRSFNNERYIQEKIENWEKKGITHGFVERLTEITRRLMRASNGTQENEVLDRQEEEWDEELKEHNNKLIGYEKDNEAIERQIKILEQLEKSNDNLFIIRGHCPTGDNLDHRESLISYLCLLSRNGAAIAREYFTFDPRRREFRTARSWIRKETGLILPNINGLINLPHDIKDYNKQVKRLKESINRSKKDLRQIMGVDIEELQPQTIEIEGKREELKKRILIRHSEERIRIINGMKKESIALMEKSVQQIDEINGQNNAIMMGGPVEYKSQFIKEKRHAVFGRFARTKWDLEISSKINTADGKEEAIPIRYVELSCVIEDVSRQLVFRRPFLQNAESSMDFTSVAVSRPEALARQFDPKEQRFLEIQPGEGLSSTGKFVLKEVNLDKGRLKLHYESRIGGDGLAGLRLFVSPIHTPRGRNLFEDNKQNIRQHQLKHKSARDHLGQLDVRLKEEEGYLHILKLGFVDEAQIRAAKGLLRELEYNEENFLKEFFPIEAHPHIKWLEAEENTDLLHGLLNFGEEELTKCLGMGRKRLQYFLLGDKKAFLSPLVAEKNIEKYFNYIPKDFFKCLCPVIEKNRIPISGIAELLRELKKHDQHPGERVTLGKLLKEQEFLRNLHQYCYQKLYDFYLKKRDKWEALYSISTILDFKKDSIEVDFQNAYIRARATPQPIVNPLSPDDIKEVRDEIEFYERDDSQSFNPYPIITRYKLLSISLSPDIDKQEISSISYAFEQGIQNSESDYSNLPTKLVSSTSAYSFIAASSVIDSTFSMSSSTPLLLSASSSSLQIGYIPAIENRNTSAMEESKCKAT